MEALEELCRFSGLKLETVEIEPLAVYRVMDWSEVGKVAGILHIGASRSYFSVFRRGLLSSLRSLSFGCSAFYQNIRGDSREEDIRLEAVEAGDGNDNSYLVRDIMSELARSLEYFEMQNEGEKIDAVFLCGGGSRLGNLDTYLTAGLGRRVSKLEYTSALGWPQGISESEKWDLRHDYTGCPRISGTGVI